MVLSLPLLSCESSVSVKKTLIEKKNMGNMGIVDNMGGVGTVDCPTLVTSQKYMTNFSKIKVLLMASQTEEIVNHLLN